MLYITFMYLLDVSHTTHNYKIVMSTTQKLAIAFCLSSTTFLLIGHQETDKNNNKIQSVLLCYLACYLLKIHTRLLFF